MKTVELIALLAADGVAVAPGSGARRFAMALFVGALGATLLLFTLFGIRSDLADATRLPMFWIKLAFPATLAAATLVAAMRLAHPGMRANRVAFALAAPVIGMWMLGGVELATVSAANRPSLIFGASWNACPFNIALLSAPLFVATLWAMKGLAPTRPVLAGAAAGLLAGAGGALVYTFYCTEMAATFLSIWYVAGVLIPAAAGALLGPLMLRW
jgi:hypothetical protein